MKIRIGRKPKIGDKTFDNFNGEGRITRLEGVTDEVAVQLSDGETYYRVIDLVWNEFLQRWEEV